MSKPTSDKRWHVTDAALQLRAEANLPPGVAGRVSGIAVTYEVVDTYDTVFARGSLKRSIASRVAAKKVPLLLDHERTTSAHVGVVTSMEEMGDAVVMTADVFDTADGRAALEYVKAVLASGASTGFSIGFVPRRSEDMKMGDKLVERFTEVELREVSITPMPAVPGADVTNARQESELPVPTADADGVEGHDMELVLKAAKAMLDALPDDHLRSLFEMYRARLSSEDASLPAPTADADGTVADTPENAQRVATMEERLRALRQSLTL